MADLSQIRDTLVGMISSLLYPSGATVSTVGVPVAIFAGWPQEADLNKDIAAGTANVSIYPGNFSRNVDRYQREWRQSATASALTTATVAGNVVTVGGVPTAGEVVGIMAAGVWFSYLVRAGDTLAGIVAGLVASIISDIRFTGIAGLDTVAVQLLDGTQIPVTAQVLAPQTVWRELRRQQHRFQISIWAPSPGLRDQLSIQIDGMFAGIDWLDVGDPQASQIRYFGVSESDAGSNATVYRRDIFYNVEYPTVETQTVLPIGALGGTQVSAGAITRIGVSLPLLGVAEDQNGNLQQDTGGNFIGLSGVANA